MPKYLKDLSTGMSKIIAMRKRVAASIAFFGGIVVFLIKLFSYVISNSIALLSDALESIVNIVASGMMLFSVSISEKPADDTHRYGHQKIEDLSSGLEGLFIIAAALLIINTAAGRLFEPVLLLQLDYAIGISVIATAINMGISILLSRTANKSGSAALEGDAKHLLSDVVSSLGVWLGLIISQVTGWQFMDSLLAFIVAALVARMGIGLVLKSSQRLMDHSCPEEEEMIRVIVEKQKPKVIEYHDLKTRRQGNDVLAEIHLTVEDTLSVREAHDIIDLIDQELSTSAPNIKLVVHIDPLTEME